MPEIDATEDLARLPGAGPGGSSLAAAPGLSSGARVSLPLSAPRANGPDRGELPAERSATGLAGAAMVVLRNFDLLVLALATVAVVVLGAPGFGFGVGAGAWIIQRVIARFDRRLVDRASEPRTKLGLNLFEAFGRIWLLAGAIILAGVAGGRADGLTAAVTICGAYSVAFVIRVLSGPPGKRATR
jgi:hypothetical protein